MDASHTTLNERALSNASLNGGSDVGIGRRMSGRVQSLLDTSGGGGGGGHAPAAAAVVTVVVRKDDNGYGMKVSGDNPVYVQSVKEGGAAEKAGLHAGDKIIKVNGHDVMQSTHTEVVALIRSATHVNLTVQQRPRLMGSPAMSVHHRPVSHHHHSSSASARITGPQPVDLEKRRELENERVHTFRLMLEKEQRYVDKLRSDLVTPGADTSRLAAELASAERRLVTLQTQMHKITQNTNELSASTTLTNTLPKTIPTSSAQNMSHSKSDNFISNTEKPPPLPERNRASKNNDNSGLDLMTAPVRDLDHRSIFSDESKNLIFGAHKIPPKNFKPPLKNFPKGEVNKGFLDVEVNSNVHQNAQPQVPNSVKSLNNKHNKQYLIENQLYHSKVGPGESTDAHNNIITDQKTGPYGSYASPKSPSGRPKLIPRDPVVKSFSNLTDLLGSTKSTHKVTKSNTIGVPSSNNGSSKFYLDVNDRTEFDNNVNSVRSKSFSNGSDKSTPPPLPPRIPLSSPVPTSPPTSPGPSSGCIDPDAVNSINKQMSYPLVATCAALVNNSGSPKSQHIVNTHHRTKSSPDPITPLESTKRRMTSESMNDLSADTKAHRTSDSWELVETGEPITPPGTPPPPYPSPRLGRNSSNISQRSSGDHSDGHFDDSTIMFSESFDVSPVQHKTAHSVVAGNSPIMAATSNVVQQPIMSMEDELSDQDVEPIKDHGPFKTLAQLWEHNAHLAVFMNYTLSNCDPSSLLFYLVTNNYREGSAKEMKKWAYEIHSSFLVPGSPLRLSNVDENIAREIDNVLSAKEFSNKEDILQKIFLKARQRAKEELNEQLADFRQKRSTGLGTLFGPSDSHLDECIHDKTKENKTIEDVLLKKLDAYIEDIDRELVDPRRFTLAAALATVFHRKFGLKQPHPVLERCPTFVSKDKSKRSRLMGKSRKMNVRDHHFVERQYYTVTYCNHCQLIIGGIGPQAFQCSNCQTNIHRHCIKSFEETCPGPLVKRERASDHLGRLLERIRPESKETRRRPSTQNFLLVERERRMMEEKDLLAEYEANNGERPYPSAPVSRAGSGRSDASGTEERTFETPEQEAESEQSHDNVHRVQRPKSTQSSINRSESYKEHTQKRRQIRERRKISDPNLSKSNDVDQSTTGDAGLSYNTNSGSSSNSSLSSNRSLDSPSTSLETVPSSVGSHSHHHNHSHHGHHHHRTATAHQVAEDSDSDAEQLRPLDPADWMSTVPEDVLARLTSTEKKRQDVFNELFFTERSHVRQLRVLENVFYKRLQASGLLTQDQLSLLFPNLEQMLELHSAFSSAMKSRRKDNPIVADIGDVLLNMFDGVPGEAFQRAASVFCARQQIALKWLGERRKKDTKLHSILEGCEAEKTCRRLQLKDLIPTSMQRLTKYPLLFENLAKYTKQCYDDKSGACDLSPEELKKVERAVERSKEILNAVNASIKEAEDFARLQEIQRRLDKTSFEKTEHPIVQEFRNLDLTKYRLIHEGPLQWRTSKGREINLHVVLLEEIVIVLQKQNEKFTLKFHPIVPVPGSSDGRQELYSPVIKLNTVHVSNTLNNSFHLINNGNEPQIYQLVASSANESEQWRKHILEAAAAYKNGENRPHRDASTPSADTSNLVESAPSNVPSSMASEQDEASNAAIAESPTSATNDTAATAAKEEESPTKESKRLSHSEDSDPTVTTQSSPNAGSTGSLNRLGVHSPLRLSTEQSLLIQPSEVHVNVRPVHTAEPVLTPLEQLRRKDELIKKALAEKQLLVADILSVPKDEFENIAELAAEPQSDREATELILAAINQANLLGDAINTSLNTTEEEAIALTASPSPAVTPSVGVCSGRASPRLNRIPGVPTQTLLGISSTLNAQLTQLLKIVKERDEEREKLRQELHKSREQIHVLHEMHRLHPELINNTNGGIAKSELETDSVDGAQQTDDSNYEGRQRNSMGGAEDVIKEEPSDCEDFVDTEVSADL